MARRKAPQAARSGAVILPEHLVLREGLNAAAYRDQSREKRQWLLDHGINPGDWSEVYPVLKASWKAHGIPDAAERARLRIRPTDERHTR